MYFAKNRVVLQVLVMVELMPKEVSIKGNILGSKAAEEAFQLPWTRTIMVPFFEKMRNVSSGIEISHLSGCEPFGSGIISQECFISKLGLSLKYMLNKQPGIIRVADNHVAV